MSAGGGVHAGGGVRAGEGMLRTEAVDVLARHRGTMLSVVTMQAIAPWAAAGQGHERNIDLAGSMGSAAALGLGLALGRPDAGVLVLDGDGSLLMQLGTLVSIGGLAPRNLFHVVFENGVYQTSGAQPVPGRGAADLCDLARAAGYRRVVRYRTAAELEGVAEVFADAGPAFVSLVIRGQGEVAPSSWPSSPGFAAQLAAMRAQSLDGGETDGRETDGRESRGGAA